MALTFAQLIDEIATVLGTGQRSGDNLRTSIGRWINNACRRIAYAYPWDSMRDDQTVTTVAPYSTGTVAVTNGSTGITFTGATLTSGMAGRKFALSIGAPFYRIASVNTGAGTAVLADAYQEETDASTTFSIFQDEYDLAATTHSVEDATLIKEPQDWPLVWTPQRGLDALDYLGSSAMRPRIWTVCTSTTVGTPRVRLYPVPDDEYRANFRYLKTWTVLSADGDLYTAGLPEDVEELILDRALRWAPRIEGSRRVMTDLEWRKELALVWSHHNKARYRTGRRHGIVSGGQPRILMNLSGIVE